MMYKDAKPVGYNLDKDKPGTVYGAKRSDTPPMQVREADGEDINCITIEIEDYMVRAYNDMMGTQKDTTERIILSLEDARYLCCHLIFALADSYDSVAMKLKRVIEDLGENYV